MGSRRRPSSIPTISTWTVAPADFTSVDRLLARRLTFRLSYRRAAVPCCAGAVRGSKTKLATMAALARTDAHTRVALPNLATSTVARVKVACIGGGPAGLYFAISMKLRDSSHDIELFERNPRGVTFGWGVVFSDQTVENLTANDPHSAKIIADEFAHWDDIDVHFRGETITSGGHGFIGIGRKRLLEILQDRARALGVILHFEAECDPADPRWKDYHLVIASDGANSRFRDANEPAFAVDIDVRANKFVWLGTSKVFDAFT